MSATFLTKKEKGDKFLITINVTGSTGPLKFPVRKDYTVSKVIEKALKEYAKEGRSMHVLGPYPDKLVLRCFNSGYDALNPEDFIGNSGCRSFILCMEDSHISSRSGNTSLEKRKGGSWKKLVIKAVVKDCFLPS